MFGSYVWRSQKKTKPQVMQHQDILKYIEHRFQAFSSDLMELLASGHLLIFKNGLRKMRERPGLGGAIEIDEVKIDRHSPICPMSPSYVSRSCWTVHTVQLNINQCHLDNFIITHICSHLCLKIVDFFGAFVSQHDDNKMKTSEKKRCQFD